jgi:hypothetical protein
MLCPAEPAAPVEAPKPAEAPKPVEAPKAVVEKAKPAPGTSPATCVCVWQRHRHASPCVYFMMRKA